MNIGTAVHPIQLAIVLVNIAEVVVMRHFVLNFLSALTIVLVRQLIGVRKYPANK